jgi:hypothetical protein
MRPAIAITRATASELRSRFEVMVLWGDAAGSVLHVQSLVPGRDFVVGEAVDARGRSITDFVIGAATLGAERLPIVRASGADGGSALLVPDGASIALTIDGRTRSRRELAAERALIASADHPAAMECALPAGAFACLSYRGFTFLVQPVPAGLATAIAPRLKLDLRAAGWPLISAGLHMGLIALFSLLPPRSSALAIDLSGQELIHTRYELMPNERLLPPPQPGQASGSGAAAPSPPPVEERAAASDPARPEHVRPQRRRGGVQNTTPADSAPSVQDAASAGIIGLLRSDVAPFGPLASVYRGETAGGGADPAITALSGGLWPGLGIGLRGPGRGGGPGGIGGAPGVGRLRTLGAGDGDPTFGAGTTRLHGLVPKSPTVRGLPATINGSLSREVIQRAIRLHMAEFRYCYEQGLAARPDLQGRVSTRFVISPSGTVPLAGIASSDLGSEAVSQCVLGVLRRLMFPAPSGGGTVDVTYPFVFQQTGG